MGLYVPFDNTSTGIAGTGVFVTVGSGAGYTFNTANYSDFGAAMNAAYASVRPPHLRGESNIQSHDRNHPGRPTRPRSFVARRSIRTRPADTFNITTTNHVVFDGFLQAVGGGVAHNFFVFASSVDCVLRGEILFSGYTATTFITDYQSVGTRYVAQVYTTDSLFIFTNGAIKLEIANVRCIMASSPGSPIVYVSGTASGGSDVNIHDCFFDGGGVLTTSAPMVVGPNGGYTMLRVNINKVWALNQVQGPADGIDVIRCSGVNISDCHFYNVNDGLSIISSNVNISNVTALNCWASGISIGDPAAQAINMSNIVVSNCYLQDNGIGQTLTPANNITIVNTTPYTISNVNITNITAQYISNVLSLYGIVINASAAGKITAVALSSCVFAGDTSAYDFINSAPYITVFGCTGIPYNQGLTPEFGYTKQRGETGADANVFTLTPPALVGFYRVNVNIDCSIWAANMGATLAYKDSNGAAVSKPLLFQDLTTGLMLTVIAATGNYGAIMPFDIDNSATNIVVATTGAVGNTYKISVALEQIV